MTLGDGLFEERNDGTGVRQVFGVFVGGSLVAQLSKAGAFTTVSYFHQDLHGSPDAVSGGSSGQAVLLGRAKYEPFGERRLASDVASPSAVAETGSVGYTGHEPDQSLGLTNMRGRIYDQRRGRFLSPDVVAQSPMSGQSWNSYSYVGNNPTNVVDPSGMEGAGIGISQFGDSAGGMALGLLFASLFSIGANLLFGSAGGASAPPSGGGVGPPQRTDDAGTAKAETPRTLDAADTQPPNVCDGPLCFRRHDGLPIEYMFPNTTKGWDDYSRARKSVDNGMRFSSPFNQGMNYMRGNGGATLVRLRQPGLVGKNAHTDLPARLTDGGLSAGRTVISIRPSEEIEPTGLLRDIGAVKGVLTRMPANLESTVFHEFGHWVGGAENQYRNSNDPRNIVNTRAVHFYIEQIRHQALPLTPSQEDAAQNGYHMEYW